MGRFSSKIFSMGTAGVLLALLAVVPGARANVITGSAFPFEGCRQDPAKSIYTAMFDSYTMEPGAPGWTACWRIIVKDQARCMQNSGFPNNRTRCCDTDFNKFKFFPAPECRHAIDAMWVNDAPQSWSWQNMSKSGVPNGPMVVKATELKFMPNTAHGVKICMHLQPPCETLQKFAWDHVRLEWNLYDKKRDNYECCPAGVTRVPLREVAARWDVPRPPPRPAAPAPPSGAIHQQQ